MNEYEDLFTKQEPVNEVAPAAPENEYDPQELFREQKVNRWLITVYFAVQILLLGFISLYMQYQFPNPSEIYANIVTVETPSFTIADDATDPEYPYLVNIRGSVQNINPSALPLLNVNVEFYYRGELLDAIDIMKEPVESLETFAFDEYYYFSLPIDEIQYSYTFDFNSAFNVMLNFSQAMVLGLSFLLIDRSNFKKRWKEFRREAKANFGKIVLGSVMVYAAMLLSQMILDLIGAAQTSQNEETIASMFTSDPIRLIMLFLLLCVFTPILEEVIFRKVIFGFLDRQFGAIVAIIVSGLIFGLMHVISYGDFVQAIPYVMMGGVFGYIYHWSKNNIYVTIGVHFINNFFAFSLYFIAVMGIAAL
jgi:uncharacterized protein